MIQTLRTLISCSARWADATRYPPEESANPSEPLERLDRFSNRTMSDVSCCEEFAMDAVNRLENDTSYELPIAGKTSFKTTCPAFRDALDVFPRRGWPIGSGCVIAKTLGLASGDVVTLVGILGDHPDRPFVALPPCSGIRAADTAGVRAVYAPELFNNASIDEDGNVELADGRFLHACEVVPATMPIQWAAREHRVVNLAIAFHGARE